MYSFSNFVANKLNPRRMISIIRLGIVLSLHSPLLFAAGIVESDTVAASDLGLYKYGPHDGDKKKAHLITLLVKDGEKVVYHKSYGYYDFFYAAREGSLVLVNPEVFGSDFDGAFLLMNGRILARLPKFRPGPGWLSLNGDSSKAVRYMPCSQTKQVVYYMIETMGRTELEKMDREPIQAKATPNSVRVACSIEPPRIVPTEYSQNKDKK